MSGTPLTPDELATIRDLHAAGKSLRAIAKEIGRGVTTVSKHVRDMGLSVDTTRVEAATAKNVATNRERRARLIGRLYNRADKIMDRLEADQFKLTVTDSMGMAHVNKVEADAIPGHEERALTGMVVNLLAGAAKLEAVDAGQTGAAEAKGILGDLAVSLHHAYGQLAHTGGTPTALAVKDELDAEG